MKRDKEKIKEVQQLIADHIKKHRSISGYSSSEQFSTLNNLSRATYEGYEKGANMNLDTFIHILGLLGLSFSEFFEELDDTPQDLYPNRLTKQDLRSIQ